MTVRRYLTTVAAEVTPPARRGTWTAGYTSTQFALGPVPAGSGTGTASTDTVTTNPYNLLRHYGISDAMAAAGNLSGSIEFAFAASSSTSAARAIFRIHGYVMAPDGSVRGTFLSTRNHGPELGGTTYMARRLTVAITTVACQVGDRIVLELGHQFVNTTSTAYAGYILAGYDADSGYGPITAADNTQVSSPNVAGWIDLPADALFSTAAAPSDALLAFF